MAIRIPFDAADNPESPTVVLAKRNGEKLGQIDAKSISISDSFNDAAELSFNVYKEINGVKCALWDEITNFKLVYCLEWNQWFEITVELDESNETVKTVFGTELGYAELGQINLYNIEINTEEDIARDDYKEPTVLFDETNPKASLLHRIMEKAPHYTIAHVDNSIAKIQRTFSFDDESIMDAFQDIAEEIKCIFIPKAETDGKTGELKRTIEVYDLQNYCPDCGHRWDSVEQDDICPECGKDNVKPGYGDDTTIFVTSDELADDIGFDTDTDAVKNCFKLEGGDDLMTATIRNCNPNGTDYLWYFSDDMKHEMPKELVDKIESYDELYEYYQKEHVVMQTANAVLNQYNQLVDKYTVFNEDLEKINVPIVGYPALMNAYYNTIDFNLYLTSSMMPSVETMETNANKELAKLTTIALSPVAVQNIDVISNATADNAVLSMARLIVDTRFKTTINSSSIVKGTNTCTWTGSFTVTNYYDEEDTATGGNIVITINENYVEFVRQKIEKQLSRDNNVEEIDIVSLFEKDYADFVNELRKYSLNRLKSFQAACQAVLDILIEQGIADKETWSSGDPNLYDDLYYPYLQKLNAINAEISLREQEISVIVGTKDTDGDVVKYGLQNYLDDYRDEIHKALDFEKYLGEELWLDFCAYRREDKYSNDNFISDALDNKELFDRAQEFIEIATQEIHKSAEQQHSISSNLKNLLVVDKFKPLVDSFSVGNWLRVMVDDTLYKLRLINYSIDYDDIENIDVEFSDVIKSNDSASDIQSVLDQASSMTTSYDSVKRQAADGKNTSNMVSGWVSDGLDLTNMMIVGNAENQNIEWGERGLLAREYLPITDTYDDRQLKLINRGLYVTSDGWETARAGIGNFMFWNPKTKKTEEAYGVIADTIVGNIILSEEVGIYNKNNSITMDGDGFTLTTNADGTDPEDIFTIQKEIKDSSGQSSIEKLLYVDSSGNLTLNGAIRVVNSYSKVTTINDLGDPDRIITESNTIIADIRADINGLSSDYSQTKQTVSDLGIKTESLSSSLTQTAAAIRGELSSSISDVNGSISDLSTEIEATAGQLRVELNNSISDVNGDISDLSTKIDVTAGQLRVDITTAVDAAGNAIDIANGSIKTVDVEYGISNSPTVEPASNAWSTNSPQWQAGKYIWQRTKTTTPEGVSSYSKAVCIQGAKGQNGAQGIPGASSYVHIKYSAIAKPTLPSQISDTPNEYIGICTDNNEDDPTDPGPYTWSKFEGKDGTQGIPGTPSYVHIKYAANMPDSNDDMSDTPNKYIGICTDQNKADPTNYTAYKWSKIEGTDGAPGENGTYVHIKYAPNGDPEDNEMKDTVDKYIGICVDRNINNPTDANLYTWSLFKAEDGAPGAPSYVHFAYSTSADGKDNFSTEPFDGAKYIGVLSNNEKDDSDTYTNYTWSLMKGDDGTGIDEIIEQYAMNTNPNSAPSTGWSTAQPEWQSGYYIWTRSEIHWSDGEITHTDPVLAKAINSANENAAFAKSYMEYNGTGLTVGQITGTNTLKSSIKMSSINNAFEVYSDGTKVTSLGSSLTFYNSGRTALNVTGSAMTFYSGNNVKALNITGSSMTYYRNGQAALSIGSDLKIYESDGNVICQITGNSMVLGNSSTFNVYNTASINVYGGKIYYTVQPPDGYTSVGGTFTLQAPTVSLDSSVSSAGLKAHASGSLLIGSNNCSGFLRDWVTENKTSNSWYCRQWASGRKEAYKVYTTNIPNAGKNITINLPYTTSTNYMVFLQLITDGTNIDHFNKISLTAFNKHTNYFEIGTWAQDIPSTQTQYKIAIHVFWWS